MKKTIIALLLITAGAKAQTTTPDSAKYFEGSLKIVCGHVSGTYTGKSGAIFINFEKPFPHSEFSAVIMPGDTAKFKKWNPAVYLKDKDVCVTGMIKMYKDKPEIIIKS